MLEINNKLIKSDLQSKSNKIKVLHLIRNEKEITRAEIIKQTGLSAPTVTRIVESLVDLKLIKTDGIGSSIGGRRPQIIKFQSDNNYVIGIDIGGTYIRSALSNLDGEFIYEIQLPTRINKGFSGVMEQVGELIDKMSDRAKKNSLSLWGIGVAICGLVNKNTGLVEFSPIFNWTNVDVRKALQKYTNLNIAIGNVVQLFAQGELLYGIGSKYSNFICLNLGYGIGSGIVVDGKLFGGTDGFAGEIGHIIVDSTSTKEGLDGLRGTLETLASGYAIADIARELAITRKESVLNKLESNEIDARKVFEAAENEDLLANEILETVSTYLCIGIDTLIKLFNTECIVLSGGLIENETILLDKIQKSIGKYSMKAITRSVPIIQSSFGENSALMGAFSLILEQILLLEQDSINT